MAFLAAAAAKKQAAAAPAPGAGEEKASPAAAAEAAKKSILGVLGGPKVQIPAADRRIMTGEPAELGRKRACSGSAAAAPDMHKVGGKHHSISAFWWRASAPPNPLPMTCSARLALTRRFALQS